MRGSSLGLEVYANADYADKANGGRSVSEIAATFGGSVVSHASKTQHVVSLSASEAESTLRLGTESKKLCLCTPFCF